MRKTPLRRKTPLPRSSKSLGPTTGGPKRKSGVKPRNAKRRSSEFVRCYGSKERVAWVKSHGCLVAAHGGCKGPIDNAHVRGGGAGRKADAQFIVGLCRAHRRYLHSAGVDYFEEMHDVSLEVYAQRLDYLWQRESARRGTV